MEHSLRQIKILMCSISQPRPTITCIQAKISIYAKFGDTIKGNVFPRAKRVKAVFIKGK